MADVTLVDSHCHLDFHHFDDDREQVLKRFAQAGGQWLLAVAVDIEHLPRLFAMAEAHDNIYCSVGIHPNHEVQEEPSVEQLCELAEHEKCVAIGETGLDFFRHPVAPEVQEQRFRTHIRAAKRLHKPLIVHMRDADQATLRVLREEGANHGVMHCFSSSWETARVALDMGLSISFSGNVTFNKNEELRQVAKQVPQEMLLIETDSPYLAPVPHRGRRNEPAYVLHVAKCIASVRGVPVEELALQTSRNAARRFGLNPHGLP